jgi:hypothetical protein
MQDAQWYADERIVTPSSTVFVGAGTTLMPARTECRLQNHLYNYFGTFGRAIITNAGTK